MASIGNKSIKVSARKCAKNLTVQLTVHIKHLFITDIGLYIAKFGIWIAGADVEIIEKEKING
jgi:hypothetical protein